MVPVDEWKNALHPANEKNDGNKWKSKKLLHQQHRRQREAAHPHGGSQKWMCDAKPKGECMKPQNNNRRLDNTIN